MSGAADSCSSNRGRYITELHDSDILLGRGQPTLNYPGNQDFRDIINEEKLGYTSTGRHALKAEIAKRILRTISIRGGRFLRKIESKEERMEYNVPNNIVHAWREVDVDVRMQKVKQALREQGNRPDRCRAKKRIPKHDLHVDEDDDDYDDGDDISIDDNNAAAARQTPMSSSADEVTSSSTSIAAATATTTTAAVAPAIEGLELLRMKHPAMSEQDFLAQRDFLVQRQAALLHQVHRKTQQQQRQAHHQHAPNQFPYQAPYQTPQHAPTHRASPQQEQQQEQQQAWQQAQRQQQNAYQPPVQAGGYGPPLWGMASQTDSLLDSSEGSRALSTHNPSPGAPSPAAIAFGVSKRPKGFPPGAGTQPPGGVSPSKETTPLTKSASPKTARPTAKSVYRKTVRHVPEPSHKKVRRKSQPTKKHSQRPAICAPPPLTHHVSAPLPDAPAARGPPKLLVQQSEPVAAAPSFAPAVSGSTQLSRETPETTTDELEKQRNVVAEAMERYLQLQQERYDLIERPPANNAADSDK